MKRSLLKKTIPSVMMVTVFGFTLINSVHAQENTSAFTHNEYEEKELKKTNKTKVHDKWKKSLTPSEIDSLKVFKSADINWLIKRADGNIDFIEKKIDVAVNNKRIQLDANDIRKNIRTLDAALMKSKQIEKDIHVYKYFTVSDVDFRIDQLNATHDITKIDREKFGVISKNFKYGISSVYLDAYLNKKESLNKGQILLDLKLPKGTHFGYLDNDAHILLPRDQGIIITNASIIVEKGKERIKLDAELVDKNIVKNKIKTKENLINEYFRAAIEKGTSIHRENEIPIETKLVNIVTHSLNASFTVNRAESLLHVLTQNIPSDLLINTLEQMRHNAPITITDSKFVNVEKEIGLKASHLDSLAIAYYDIETKQLILNLNKHEHQINPFKEIVDGSEAVHTDSHILLHEFGHAVDELLLNDLSNTSEFKELYEEEKNNIKIEKYMKTHPKEFFASAFAYLFSPNTQYQMRIKQEAPKTVVFIQNALKEKGLLNKEI
ncbi:ADP-ribosyltransferase [Bacillus cereus group sp. BfR-BA-01524]|uniref:anthrax toxin lethal factor-related metalloendopeptidase n=1 Tax=Bacillus cereus group sp. BfR-BA-01524 TaxID=2920372 RepID=UPI001F566186